MDRAWVSRQMYAFFSDVPFEVAFLNVCSWYYFIEGKENNISHVLQDQEIDACWTTSLEPHSARRFTYQPAVPPFRASGT